MLGLMVLFWLRLCGCTPHPKAESGKCMGPEKRRLASLLALDWAKAFDWQIQFPLPVWSMQCGVSVFHIISVRWSVTFTMGGTSWCEMEA